MSLHTDACMCLFSMDATVKHPGVPVPVPYANVWHNCTCAHWGRPVAQNLLGAQDAVSAANGRLQGGGCWRHIQLRPSNN